MKITGPELTAEFQRARSKWPFIHQTANFGRNVPRQCATAAAMLHTDLAITGGKVEEAAASNNSGHPDRLSTTHHGLIADGIVGQDTARVLGPDPATS
jgi:hypothetical protein